MIPLRPHLPFAEDETPISWATRLAARHAHCGPDHFLTDLGLASQALLRGDPETVARLAAAGGADPGLVQRNTVRRLGRGRSSLRGEEFYDDFALGIQTRVCPRCLVEDAAGAAHDLRVLLRARLAWLFPTVRVCPSHGVPLMDTRGDLLIFARRPMSMYALANWENVRRAADTAADASPGPLQRYVIDRLEGRAGPAWLDGQQIDLAVKACELLGATVLRGARPNIAAFSEAERDEAEAAGFAVASGGEHAVRALFSQLQSQCRTDDGHAGPKAMFGYLFEWASVNDHGRDRGPLLDLLFTHINETLPVGPGDKLFGRTVETRHVHSVRTLSAAYRLNPVRLRKLLEARAVIPPAMRGMSDNRALFEAAAGEAVAEKLVGGVSMKQARTYLGAPLTLVGGLLREGLIRPLIVPDAEHQLGEYRFAKADLDAFLASLLDGAAPVEGPNDAFIPVKKAAHSVVQSVPALLRAVLDGRLRERRRVDGVHGLAGLLVDHAEVRAQFRSENLSAFYSAFRIKRRLRTTERVVAALMADRPGGSVLPTTPAPAELPRAERVVPVEAVEAFDRDYVSLAILARDRRSGPIAIKRRLEALDIVPAFDPEMLHASFYRRDALPPDF